MSAPNASEACPAPPAPTAAVAPRPYSIGLPTGPNVRRLHLNEFRFAHAPKVVDALRGALAAPVDELLTWYQAGPDPTLLAALARYVGAPSARHVLAAAGSDEVLRAVLDTSGLRGHRRLLMGVPGYTHF
jgi:histidinol-phosphate/aromatic aminotransferase/cobyric acid decarboxylase-like protein